jgi:uncharacterized protein DUF5990
MASAEPALTLRIVLEAPPPGVDFGVQKGRGAGYETIHIQRSDRDDLTFEFTVVAKPAAAGDAVDFGGPIVQGPRGDRFIYIDIGTYAGQKNTPWCRRLKVPLIGITPDLVRRASSRGNRLLEARVPGTGGDGGPACASVRNFSGWKPAL